MKTLDDVFSADASLFQQESLLLEATELICAIMEKNNISKADLARKMGKSKAYVTQCLSGEQNLTLRTLADFFTALNYQIQMGAVPIAGQDGRAVHRLYAVGAWAYEKIDLRQPVIDCAAVAQFETESELCDVA